MFERLLSLDGQLTALGTKLFVAKEQAISNISYGAFLASEKVNELKPKKKESVKKEEPAKNVEQVKKEESDKKVDSIKKEDPAKPVDNNKNENNTVKTTAIVVPTVKGRKPEKIEAEIVESANPKNVTNTENVKEEVIVDEEILTRGVIYGPDFSGYENVTIPMEEPVPAVQPIIEDGKEVTQADIDAALKKIADNMLSN